MRERLRRMRYFVADVGFAIGSAVRRGARKVSGAASPAGARISDAGAAGRRGWMSLSLSTRRRVAAGLAAAFFVLLFVLLAVPALPCEFPGGDRCPPDDDAAELVPDTAVGYLHVNLDPDTEQYEELAEVADGFPLIGREVAKRALALVPGLGGTPADFRRRVAPWLGGEIAVALVPGSGGGDRVFLLETSDSKRAAQFARSLAAGAVETERYRGAAIATDEQGLATAERESFLVVGSPGGVRAVVDTATGAKDAGSLADDPNAEAVRDELPEHRFAEAWFSPAGSGELVRGPGAPLGPLAPFISPGTTRGAAVSLSAGDESLELAVRSELDREREKAAPAFFAAFPPFEPELPDRLSPDALGYLGIGEPGRTVRALLRQAAAEAPGIVGGFEDLVARLQEQASVNVEKKLLPALGDEGAFAIERAKAFPFLEFVARGVDEEDARRALAELQRPIAGQFDPGTALQAPVFGEQQIDGVEVRSLRISPVIELAYAVFDGLAAVATNPAGIERLIEGDGGLDSSSTFERATEGFGGEVSLLAFLDLRRLLVEGFSLGLAEDPAFATFSRELRRLDALGLRVKRDDDLLATDARLLVTR